MIRICMQDNRFTEDEGQDVAERPGPFFMA